MKKTDFLKLSPKQQDESKTVKFTVKEKAGVVVCRLIDRWYGKQFVGKTHCHEVDQWDEKKGRAIAFNKARRNELTYNIKQCEAEKQYYTDQYNEMMARIEKRVLLNEIYLTGVNLELDELMGKHVEDETSETNN